MAGPLSVSCPASVDPATYRLSYTGIDPLDRAMCILVSFFQYGMTERYTLYMTYQMVQLLGVTLVLILEGYTSGASGLAAYPSIGTGITNLIGVSLCVPLYWISFIANSTIPPRRATLGRAISRRDAVIASLVFIVGGVLPSAWMMQALTPKITAFWQFYPAVIGAVGLVLRVFPGSPANSGRGFARMISVLTFIGLAASHIYIAYPIARSDSWPILLPSMALAPEVESDWLSIDYLNWDIFISCSATIFSMMWYAPRWSDIFRLLAWNVAAIPLFGYGAAVAGSMLV
ncbi:hypothetical protein FISHEDRAFT_37921 [Fistulina hepatica ATCC 64428]|nr:hypothetical protein FISHEDRAFT_37921 [Fistulina hepatica ATCC 64428]